MGEDADSSRCNSLSCRIFPIKERREDGSELRMLKKKKQSKTILFLQQVLHCSLLHLSLQKTSGWDVQWMGGDWLFNFAHFADIGVLKITYSSISNSQKVLDASGTL